MESTHEHCPIIYEIKVQGELDHSWETFFEGLAFSMDHAAGQSTTTTILVGSMIDQPALRGLLCKLWDLNLTLLSVRRLKPDFATEKKDE